MNIKKLSTYKFISLLLAIICVTVVLFTPHLSLIEKVNIVDTSKAYTYNGNEKVEFTDFGKTLDVKEFDLYIDVTNNTDKDYLSIGTYNYYQAVEFYNGDELLYQYGTLEDLNNNTHLGNKYVEADYLIDIGETETIRVHYSSNYNLTIYNLDVNTKEMIEFYQYLILMPIIGLAFISLVSIIVFIVIIVQKKYLFISRETLSWVCYFILASSLWIVADSQLLVELGLDAGVTCQISFELYPIFTLALLKTVQSINHTESKFINIFTLIAILNFIVLNILDFTGLVPFIHSLLSTHIITVCIMIIIMWLLGREFKENHTKRNAILFYGFMVFMILAFIQFALFFIYPASNNSFILILGIGVLYFTFIHDVLHVIDVQNKKNDNLYKKMIEEANEKLRKRNELLYKTFGKLVPNDKIDNLIDNNFDKSIDGANAYCTVLDADIRGFTDLIGDMDPTDVISMLNSYLKVMTSIIYRYNGTVIEYIGDAIIAVFGAPIDDKNHASSAVAAALEMQNAMKNIIKYNKENNLPLYEIGVGLNSGNIYIGYLGSEKHMKFDIIGNTVNLCSRIESKSTGGQILISEETYKLVKNIDIDQSYQITPKGHNEALTIYSVVGIGKPYNVTYAPNHSELKTLEKSIKVNFRVIDDSKSIGSVNRSGEIIKMSEDTLVIKTDEKLKVFDNIHLDYKGEVYGKVVEACKDNTYRVRLTLKNN